MPSLVLPFTLTAPTATPSARATLPRIASTCGASFGRSAITTASTLTMTHSRRRLTMAAARRSRSRLSASLNCGIGIRKVTADVTRARGAENGVGDGVTHGIRIRMSHQPLVERNRDATEHERTPGDQPMQVVAVPDSHRRRATRAAKQSLRHVEILRRRDFQVPRIAVDQMHVMARLLGEHRLVGRLLPCGRRERDRVARARRRERPVVSAPGRSRLARERLADARCADASPRFTVSPAGSAAIAAPACDAASIVRSITAQSRRTGGRRRESARSPARARRHRAKGERHRILTSRAAFHDAITVVQVRPAGPPPGRRAAPRRSLRRRDNPARGRHRHAPVQDRDAPQRRSNCFGCERPKSGTRGRRRR